MAEIPASDDFFFLSHIAFSAAPIAAMSHHLTAIERVSRTGRIRSLVPLLEDGAVFTTAPWDRMQIISTTGRAALIEISEGEQRQRRGWVPLAWLRPAPQLEAHDLAPELVAHAAEPVRRAG